MKRRRLFRMILWVVGLGCASAQPENFPVKEDDSLFATARDLGELAKRGTPPVPIRQPGPDYPVALRRMGLGGEVVVAFVVDAQGEVREAHVHQSNNIWLERPALDAVLRWKFKPGTIDGKPVNTRLRVPIYFRLESGGNEPWTISKKNHDKLPEELRWDEPPKVVGAAYPVYPLPALQEGAKGKVTCTFIVGPRGYVDEVTFRNEARVDFKRAVQAALDNWRFHPARKGGKPSMAALSMEFEFNPNGNGLAPVPDSAADILKSLKNPKTQFAQAAELDQPLRPMSRRPPAYPPQLRASNIEGEAVIEFFIDHKGDAQLPHIVSSSQEEFGYAAAQSVASWRFRPPTKSGKPVVARVRVPVVFSLKDQKSTPRG